MARIVEFITLWHTCSSHFLWLDYLIKSLIEKGYFRIQDFPIGNKTFTKTFHSVNYWTRTQKVEWIGKKLLFGERYANLCVIGADVYSRGQFSVSRYGINCQICFTSNQTEQHMYKFTVQIRYQIEMENKQQPCIMRDNYQLLNVQNCKVPNQLSLLSKELPSVPNTAETDITISGYGIGSLKILKYSYERQKLAHTHFGNRRNTPCTEQAGQQS